MASTAVLQTIALQGSAVVAAWTGDALAERVNELLASADDLGKLHPPKRSRRLSYDRDCALVAEYRRLANMIDARWEDGDLAAAIARLDAFVNDVVLPRMRKPALGNH